MKILEEAKFTMFDVEFCEGCDQVSEYTGACYGTDQ